MKETYNPRQFLLWRLENKPGIAFFITYVCLSLCLSSPPNPPPRSMLNYPRWIMHKDSQLKLDTDTGGGEESKSKAKLSNLPKSFELAMIVSMGAVLSEGKGAFFVSLPNPTGSSRSSLNDWSNTLTCWITRILYFCRIGGERTEHFSSWRGEINPRRY